MNRFAYNIALVAVLAALAFASPAFADVGGTLTNTSNWVSLTARAGAALVIILAVFAAWKGHGGLTTVVAMMIALAVLIYPQEIASLVL